MSTPSNKFNLTMKKELKRITNRKNLNQLGKEAIKIMTERVQGQGKGVKKFGGNKAQIAPLKDSTIARRKRSKKLSGKTTPSTSNLTHTGKMIADMTFLIKGMTGLLFYFSTDRSTQVANHVQDKRPFFTLAKTEINQLAKFFKNLTRK